MKAFHCNHIKIKYDGKIELLLTDSDCLLYKNEAKIFFEVFFEII